MSHLDQFIAAFGVWDELLPYLSLIVDEAEMRLIVAMQGEALTAGEVASRFGIPVEQATSLLQRSYSRCIVDKADNGGITTYRPANLRMEARLDHYAKYENWDDIPADARRAIDRRFLDEFIARQRAKLDTYRTLLSQGAAPQDLEAGDVLPNDTVLLLDQVDEMLDAATHIAVQPCDCRRLGQYCDRPVETCISLDDVALKILDRGHGRRLTREEAKKLVRWADRKGLMHTADGEWRARGLHAICNCGACDCYPFRAAQELGSKGVWPRSLYVAHYDAESCHLCGACVKRCHFEAFYHDGSPQERAGLVVKNVLFDADKCWGCGLCANVCPVDAITMQPCR
jgi:ferredoxin